MILKSAIKHLELRYECAESNGRPTSDSMPLPKYGILMPFSATLKQRMAAFVGEIEVSGVQYFKLQ